MTPWQLSQNDPLVGETMQNAVDNIVKGIASPKDALAQAVERVKARL